MLSKADIAKVYLVLQKLPCLLSQSWFRVLLCLENQLRVQKLAGCRSFLKQVSSKECASQKYFQDHS